MVFTIPTPTVEKNSIKQEGKQNQDPSLIKPEVCVETLIRDFGKGKLTARELLKKLNELNDGVCYHIDIDKNNTPPSVQSRVYTDGLGKKSKTHIIFKLPSVPTDRNERKELSQNLAEKYSSAANDRWPNEIKVTESTLLLERTPFGYRVKNKGDLPMLIKLNDETALYRSKDSNGNIIYKPTPNNFKIDLVRTVDGSILYRIPSKLGSKFDEYKTEGDNTKCVLTDGKYYYLRTLEGSFAKITCYNDIDHLKKENLIELDPAAINLYILSNTDSSLKNTTPPQNGNNLEDTTPQDDEHLEDITSDYIQPASSKLKRLGIPPESFEDIIIQLDKNSIEPKAYVEKGVLIIKVPNNGDEQTEIHNALEKFKKDLKEIPVSPATTYKLHHKNLKEVIAYGADPKSSITMYCIEPGREIATAGVVNGKIVFFFSEDQLDKYGQPTEQALDKAVKHLKKQIDEKREQQEQERKPSLFDRFRNLFSR